MPYPALASVLAYSSTEFQRGSTKGKGGLLVLGSLFCSSQRFPSLKNFQPLPKVCTTYPEAVFLSNPQLHMQTQPSLGKGWEQVTKNDPDVVLSKPETLQPTQEFFPPRSFVQSCRLVHAQDKFDQKKGRQPFCSQSCTTLYKQQCKEWKERNKGRLSQRAHCSSTLSNSFAPCLNPEQLPSPPCCSLRARYHS